MAPKLKTRMANKSRPTLLFSTGMGWQRTEMGESGLKCRCGRWLRGKLPEKVVVSRGCWSKEVRQESGSNNSRRIHETQHLNNTRKCCEPSEIDRITTSTTPWTNAAIIDTNKTQGRSPPHALWGCDRLLSSWWQLNEIMADETCASRALAGFSACGFLLSDQGEKIDEPTV